MSVRPDTSEDPPAGNGSFPPDPLLSLLNNCPFFVVRHLPQPPFISYAQLLPERFQTDFGLCERFLPDSPDYLLNLNMSDFFVIKEKFTKSPPLAFAFSGFPVNFRFPRYHRNRLNNCRPQFSEYVQQSSNPPCLP